MKMWGLVVDHQYRNLGIGRQLIQGVVDRCYDEKIRLVWGEANEEEFPFFEHLGFERVMKQRFKKASINNSLFILDACPV